MKEMVGVILVFLLSTGMGAQPGEGGNTCEVWEVVVTDNSCSDSGGCVSSAQFQAPNCPTFYLSCGIYSDCLGSGNCKVTATIYTYPGHAQVGDRCQNWTQDPYWCGGGPSSGLFSLTPWAWYTLEVCFGSCSLGNCSQCSGCYARGRISVQQ